MLDNGNIEPTVCLRSDAQMNGFVTGHDIGFVIVYGIAFGALAECLDQSLHDEGKVGEFWGPFRAGCIEVLAE